MAFVKTRSFLDSSSSWEQTWFLISSTGAELNCRSSRIRPNEHFWDHSVAWVQNREKCTISLSNVSVMRFFSVCFEHVLVWVGLKLLLLLLLWAKTNFWLLMEGNLYKGKCFPVLSFLFWQKKETMGWNTIFSLRAKEVF